MTNKRLYLSSHLKKKILTLVKKMKTPFSEKLNPRNELTRLGDIDFVGSAVDDVLTKTAAGFAFDAMNLGKLSDVVVSNNNLGIGSDVLSGTSASGVVALGFEAGKAGSNVKDESVIIGYQAAALGVGEHTVAIGRSAGHGVNAKDSDNSVIIGYGACTGLSGTYNDDAIAIGTNAGIGGVGTSSIALGDTASAKGDRNISIGKAANLNSSSTQSICIGEEAGNSSVTGTLQGNDFICIGNSVGKAPDIKSKSISIGSTEINSGFSSGTSGNGVGYGTIVIGTSALGVANSTAKRGALSVVLGGAAAYNGISGNSVAIGALAATTNPAAEGTVSVGFNAGSGTSSSVQSKAVSIGDSSNIATAGLQACAIGYSSHSGGNYSQALGANASSSGISAIAVGAGAQAQGVGSIGVGGRYNGGASYGALGDKAVVIGDGTALNGAVGAGSVIVGESAGLSGSGTDNVLLGAFSNSSTSTNNAAVINATGANLAGVASGFVVKPIAIGSNSDLGTIKRPSDTNFDHYLAYNATTGEIRAVLHGG